MNRTRTHRRTLFLSASALAFAALFVSISGAGSKAGPASPQPFAACTPTLSDTGARITAGSAPARAVIKPDGSEVYVTNNSSNNVTVINTATDAVTHTIPVGSVPDPIAVSPDGSKVYVGNQSGVVSVISTAAHAVTATITVGGQAADLALTPDGSKLYVATVFNNVAVINTATNAVGSLPSGGCPEGVGVTPDGSTLYVNYQCGGPGGSGGHDAVGRFSVATNAFLGSTTGLPNVGGRLFISPGGAQVWENGSDACSAPFYNHVGCPFVPAGVVNVISISTNALQQSIGFAGFSPGHVSFLPDGSRALVGNGANLSLFDTTSFALTQNIAMPASGSVVFAPSGKAYAPLPSQNQVAVLSLTGCPATCVTPPGPSGAWAARAPVSSARFALAAAELNGTLYDLGGTFGFCDAQTTLEAYDPSTNTWTPRAPMPTGRYHLGAASLGGKLYAVAGGASCGVAYATVEAYDPSTNSWATKAPIPSARTGLRVAAAAGRLYALGGADAGGTVRPDVWEYDPATNVWTPKAPMPDAVQVFGVGVVNNRVYVVGGQTNFGVPSAPTYVYDPAADSWSTKAPMPTPRNYLGAAALGGKIYAYGGDNPSASAVVEVYDPATDTWASQPSMLTARAEFGSAAVAGKLYAVAGWTGATRFSSVEAFTPNGMVAWWPGDGNALEIAGGNNGALLNGAAFAAGEVGQAFSFDGAHAVVSTPLVLSYANGATLDAWVKTTDDDGLILSDGGGASAGAGMGLFVEPPGIAALFGSKGTADDLNFRINGPFIADGNFHHLTGTWRGDASPGGVKLYVDGQLVGNATAQTAIGVGSTPFQLGWHTIITGHRALAGLVDEAEVFNRALTQTEIQSIYNAGAFGKCKPATNHAPVADAGPDLTVECALTTVTLDGSNSSDPNGDSPLSYTWSEGITQLGTGATLGVNLGYGPHTITLTVTDPGGLSSTDTVNVNVTDAQPPVIAGSSACNASSSSMIAAPNSIPGSNPNNLTPVLRFALAGTGAAAPLPDIPSFPATAVNDPIYTAFNSAGELFVTNRHGNTGGGDIARFTFDSSGAFTPHGVISGNGLDAPHGLAFSPSGELFVGDSRSGFISRFKFDPSGNAVPNGVFFNGGNPQGIAFNAAGEMFTARSDDVVSRWVFDPSGAAVAHGSFSVPGAVAVHGLAFSQTGELFAADIYSSRVYRFTFDSSGNAVPNGYIDAPGGSLGVAFSGEGELFVSFHFSGGIARFLFDSSGGAAPNGLIPAPNMGGLSVFTRSCAQPGVGSLAGVTADADATSCSASVNVTTPTATDDCGGAVNVFGSRSDDQPLSAPYPVGTTTITWTAADGAGNTSTATQTVTVVDHTPPVIAGSSPANEISINFDDGQLPSSHGWTFVGFDQFLQPLAESQAASVSGGVLRLDTVPFGGVSSGSGIAFWRKPTTGIDPSNYDYEIRMRALAPDSTRNCFGGLLGAGVEVRESFDSDFTLMTPQLHIGGFSPAPVGGPCYFGVADGGSFHTYKVVVRNDTHATLYVDGVLQPVEGTLVRPNEASLEAVFGDITTSGGNSTAEIDFVRVASAASPLAGVTADAGANSCSALVNVTPPSATDNCGGVTVAGVRSDNQPLGAPYPVGSTVITWTATDAHGNTSGATQTVTVRDAQAPSVAGLSASPASIWPPNHSMQNVTVSYNASDACGAVNCVITSVTSNEPLNGTGDGDTAPDWLVTDAHHVQLRAERAGNGSGRVYTITVACTDSAGNTTTKTVAVTVPKSQGK